MSDTEFSVFWWDELGLSYPEARFVSAATALLIAAAVTKRDVARDGRIQRVIVTDGGDCTVFEWKHGAGVTFPPPTREEMQ